MGAILQNASGYGGLDQTPLARPGYHEKIMARVYERDWIREITNSQIAERITADTQTVQIMKAPTTGRRRRYQKNQPMIPSQVTTTAICLSICNAAYLDIKVDDLDIHWSGPRWSSFEDAFLEDAYQNYTADQREWVLNAMLAEASPQTQGLNAGKYHNWNLGERGNPVIVNATNIAREMSILQQVLMDQLAWRENEMFCVMPTLFRTVLVQSNFANAAWTGTAAPGTIAIDGLWPHQLSGFDIIETIHAPSFIDDNGDLCFYIIAGSTDAFAYAGDIIRGRLIDKDPNTFGVRYQTLDVWGGKMIYPERVAVACWRFQV